MNVELLIALAAFAFVSSITPGPNNLMLMTSGTNFGFRKTVPHMLGVGLGFTFMVVLVGLGVIQIFDLFPVSYQILKVLSVAYLLFLAFKIAKTSEITEGSAQKRPMTFIQAALFQWVNPKAWTMAVTAISVYAPNKELMAVIIVAGVFGLINLPCICSWITLGQKIKYLLASERSLKYFNYSMAALLIVSVVPALT